MSSYDLVWRVDSNYQLRQHEAVFWPKRLVIIWLFDDYDDNYVGDDAMDDDKDSVTWGRFLVKKTGIYLVMILMYDTDDDVNDDGDNVDSDDDDY